MIYDIDNVHNEILDNITDSYQKTPGFPMYDITRGIAYGELKLWLKAQEIKDKQDVDNLVGDELDVFISERTGLKRKKAQKATGAITITVGTGQITEGNLFESNGGVQYEAIQSKYVTTGDEVKIQCVKTGISGNVAANVINKMPVTLPGIVNIANPNPVEGGTDIESDESYRARYYTYLRAEATCGNVEHYLQWARSVPGVGAAACFPLWAGDNTVKVVILNDDMQPPDNDIVRDTQNYIDPDKKGWGEGAAPVGAYCTVVAAQAININISAKIKKNTGYTTGDIIAEIQTAITEYLKTIAFKQNYVSYGQVGAAIIAIEGVSDYSDLTLNGSTANVNTIDYNNVAVLGEVTIIDND